MQPYFSKHIHAVGESYANWCQGPWDPIEAWSWAVGICDWQISYNFPIDACTITLEYSTMHILVNAYWSLLPGIYWQGRQGGTPDRLPLFPCGWKHPWMWTRSGGEWASNSGDINANRDKKKAKNIANRQKKESTQVSFGNFFYVPAT